MTPLLFTIVGQTASLQLEMMPTGFFDRVKGYVPFGLKLSDLKPESLRKTPEVAKAKYGWIKVGDRTFLTVLDGEKLYVDSNADGDLTNDRKVEWAKRAYPNGTEAWQGSAKVDVLYGGKVFACTIGLYSTDREDEVGYYHDFALAGKAVLNGKSYPIVYNDPSAAWDGIAGTLMIDKDGDGKFHPGYEFFRAKEPFNIGGTTFEMKGLALVKSAKTVAERTLANSAPSDPNLANGLRVGKEAFAFEATALSGKQISFPSSYKGKVVLVDFWATWCGPCMREVPGLVKVYNSYRDRGFEVLGVSLDRKDSADQVKAVAAKNGMTWEQVYDGNYFDAKLAKQYGIKAIPATYLVDGDTGKILAMGDELRGERLQVTVKKALAAKKQ